MIKIIRERNTGKTRELMEAAKAQNGVFVCSDAARYQRKAECYGIYGLEIMSYQDMNDTYDEHTLYFIDNLDDFLSLIIPNLAGFDLTSGD